MDHIGFFCSSREPAIPMYGHLILPLLTLLYEQGTRTIYYGGGDKGLMGLIYHHGTSLGIKVVGHNMKKWSQPELSNEILYERLVDRQNGLILASQYYIVLPGGIGTIYELSQVLCNNDVERLGKKVILFNSNNYYDSFETLINHSMKEGLTDRDRLEFTTVRNLIEFSSLVLKKSKL